MYKTKKEIKAKHVASVVELWHSIFMQEQQHPEFIYMRLKAAALKARKIFVCCTL